MPNYGRAEMAWWQWWSVEGKVNAAVGIEIIVGVVYLKRLQFLNDAKEDFWNFCNITDRSFTGEGQTAAGFSNKFPGLRGD